MFRWSHEHLMEVNIPVQKMWDIYINPSNWPKWVDQFDFCTFEDELKTGTVVKTKIKNRNAYIQIQMIKIKPHEECKFLIKVPLFTQESSCIFQEISTERTLLIMKTSVISLFVPFMKSFFHKRLEHSNSKYLRVFSEIAENESR